LKTLEIVYTQKNRKIEAIKNSNLFKADLTDKKNIYRYVPHILTWPQSFGDIIHIHQRHVKFR